MEARLAIQTDSGAAEMKLDKEKAIKLVIVTLATLAALAVMSTLVQLIQTILPFLIVGAGITIAYRWALSDAPPPSADEVEEQARGLFSRFRRAKKAVDTTMKVGDALGDLADTGEKKTRRRRRSRKVDAATASAKADAAPREAANAEANKGGEREEELSQSKTSRASKRKGAIEFKDSDVVINEKDIEQPDISRLEEKEKEVPEVTNNVLAQIEERRRRLEGDS